MIKATVYFAYCLSLIGFGYHTFPGKSGSPAIFETNRMYVVKANVGAAKENARRFFRIFDLSTPSYIRNVTSPNAAGALCNIMARNTMNSTSTWCVAAADPVNKILKMYFKCLKQLIANVK